ncbi:fibroblast growth factor 1-like [Atheta coriaria]|uniref:fibroblast growth factor 1-like n=1 Tax=Dalotia coriaria TaxID=877792 RepID=UPI0031F36367
MYTLNEVSSESSSDNDESVDEDFVDHASSSQSTHNQSTHQSSSQVEEMEITRSKRSLRSKPLGPYEGVPLSEYVKGDRMQLFCRSQQFLAIYPDGKVRGTSEKSDPHTQLEMIPTGYPGHVVIKGILANLYVTMNNKGKLRSQDNRDAEMFVFIEGIAGAYLYYKSLHFAECDWYLGIKKSGKSKNGQKTKIYEKAVHFLKLKS